MASQSKSDSPKPLAYRLLRCLQAEVEYPVSGLAQRLRCTEDEVLAACAGLPNWLTLSATADPGIRLSQSPQWLDTERIVGAIAPTLRPRLGRLETRVEVDSTNAKIRRSWLENKVPDEGIYVCLAEYQSAGRGRRGREWLAPLGANLTFSLGWCQHELSEHMAFLPLVMGLACAEVVAETLAGSAPQHAVGVKWPNDVLVDGAKLAGLLVESSQTAGIERSRFCVVVGIGMNISVTEQLTRGVDQAIVGLDTMAPVDRNELAGRLISRCMGHIDLLRKDGFEPFRSIWERYDLLLGREVVVRCGDALHIGVAKGLGAGGELMLEVNGELLKFISADVSVRIAS